MTGHGAPTLKTWAVLELVYGLLVAALLVWAVPWKTPWVNTLGLVYAAAVVGPAPGLWRGNRLCHRAAIVTGAMGFGLGVVAVSLLLTSSAYLRAIFGGLGAGVWVVVLLLAAVVFQWLGLYPALKLRALLRRDVRDAANGSAGKSASAVLLGLCALPLPLAAVVDRAYALAPRAAVPTDARALALRALRAALDDAAPVAVDGLRGVERGDGPLGVTVWKAGVPRVRLVAEDGDLAAAVTSVAAQLRACARSDRELGSGRIKVDRVVARGPVFAPTFAALGVSLDPGLDGLMNDGGRPVFWPDDVLKAAVFGAAPLLPALDELRFGVSSGWLREKLGPALAAPPASLARFRTESWMETGRGGAGVHRGRVEGPPPTLQAAASAAGGYIARQVGPDGRFEYRYQPLANEALPGAAYNLPRHAGVIFSLSLLYGQTRDPAVLAAATAGIGFLLAQIPAACGDATRACVVEGGRAPLGSTALAAVALLEYGRRTGDRQHDAVARRLTAFLLSAQLPDGTFNYLFDLAAGAFVPAPARLFAAEEATLALVLAFNRFGDRAHLAAARRSLNYLTGAKYQGFLGHFLYGAEAWTCQAAEAAWPDLKEPAYRDFCVGYARFLRRLQFQPDPDGPAADFAGHYGFGTVMVPQAAGTAGLTEGVLSAYALSRAHGVADDELRAQAELSLGALARDQMGANNSYMAPDPLRAAGAIRRSLAEPEVRIDFVQHAAAAFVRAAAMGLATR